MGHKIKAVLFDFDMTLADTEKGVFATYKALTRFANLFPHKQGIGEYMGKRVSENIELFTKNKKEKKMLYNLFLKVFIHEIPYFTIYGKEILDYLKENKIKIIIISNNSRRALKAACRYWKIPYDYILGDEDMRQGWEKHEEMSSIIKKLHLKKNQVFYVGDHIHDILEGKKAKVRVISVTTGVYAKKDLVKYKPYRIVSDLNQLREII